LRVGGVDDLVDVHDARSVVSDQAWRPSTMRRRPFIDCQASPNALRTTTVMVGALQANSASRK
jgi:hypothetical protein